MLKPIIKSLVKIGFGRLPIEINEVNDQFLQNCTYVISVLTKRSVWTCSGLFWTFYFVVICRADCTRC